MPFRILDEEQRRARAGDDARADAGNLSLPVSRGSPLFAVGPGPLHPAARHVARSPADAGRARHPPLFSETPGTRLRFASLGVWPPDAPEAVTLGCEPLIEGLDFGAGPDVSAMVIDRLYEGWDGRAELIAADGFRTMIEADGVLDKLQIYSAWDYPYVCVEPVSNANDGFNRMAAGVPSHGVRVLEPGRSIEGTVRIFVPADPLKGRAVTGVRARR